MLPHTSSGYLIQIRGWRPVFYILSAVHLGIFFLHLFFGPETIYLHRYLHKTPEENQSEQAKQEGLEQFLGFRRYSTARFHIMEIIRPFTMVLRPVILLPAVACAMMFAYTVVETVRLIRTLCLLCTLLTRYYQVIFVPQKFHLTPGPFSLQFIALLIGALIGEPLAGYGGDKLVEWRTKRAGGERIPEYRLPLAYLGFLLSVVGMIGTLSCIYHSPHRC